MAVRRKKRRIRRDRGKPAGGFARGYSGSLKAAAGADDLIDQAVSIWQKHAGRPLTREDGREIVENLTGFFGLLEEWRFAEQIAEIKKVKKSAASDDGKAAAQNAKARLAILDESRTF